jgi:hypothetical protein
MCTIGESKINMESMPSHFADAAKWESRNPTSFISLSDHNCPGGKNLKAGDAQAFVFPVGDGRN